MKTNLNRLIHGMRQQLPLLVMSAVLVASVVIGLFVNTQLFVIAMATTTVLVIGLVWPWIGVRNLVAELSFFTLRVREGEQTKAMLRLRNRAPWPIFGLRFATACERIVGKTGVVVLKPLGELQHEWRFEARHRGQVPRPDDEVGIASGFPFGIYEARRSASVERRLIVWPRTFKIGALPLIGVQGSRAGAVMTKKAGASGDVLGTRPYRQGDALRRIHWGQTARHDRLIVCEFQATGATEVQLVLDTDPCVHRGEGRDNSLEWSIRIAASFAESFIDEGVVLDTVVGGERIPPNAGRPHLARVMDAFAVAGNDPVSPLSEILRNDALQPQASRIVVTTDIALIGIPPTQLRGTHLVVLHAAAFDTAGQAESPPALPVKPWIWIESSTNVEQQTSKQCERGFINAA